MRAEPAESSVPVALVWVAPRGWAERRRFVREALRAHASSTPTATCPWCVPRAGATTAALHRPTAQRDRVASLTSPHRLCVSYPSKRIVRTTAIAYPRSYVPRICDAAISARPMSTAPVGRPAPPQKPAPSRARWIQTTTSSGLTVAAMLRSPRILAGEGIGKYLTE